jgi:3-dehydroquinate synthase
MRFHFEKQTKVRYFSSQKEIQVALARAGNFIFLDPNVTTSFSPSAKVFRLAPGEECKKWRELEAALAWLSGQGAEKSQTLAAVGGGAALDLSALAASLYRRGMKLILVPTTLLAMVDATLGGKTAVDRSGPNGLEKNFAGTFFPADEVWICLEYLRTLPSVERLSGAGEVWKTLWLSGSHLPDLSLRRFVSSGEVSPGLKKIIGECLKIKGRIVERDPLDQKRVREVLNYGHTVGHALESLSGRPHGEAVLWGMAVESSFLGRAGLAMSQRVLATAESLGISYPSEFSLPAARWLPLLKADKKSKKEKIEVSVLSAPGKIVRRSLTPAQITEAITNFPKFFRP